MRKENSRTVLNRKALDAISAGFVEAMSEMGRTVIARADPPDDPVTAEKIKGDWGVWANGRKVAGGAAKPRGAKVKQGITLIAGFEFPARFNELGTVHQPARPFFTPVVFDVLPGSEAYVRPKVRAALARVR